MGDLNVASTVCVLCCVVVLLHACGRAVVFESNTPLHSVKFDDQAKGLG